MTYSIPGDIRTKVQTSTSVGGIDSPFTKTRAVLDMIKGWEVMKAVTEGTEYLRENSEAFLPLEPREDYTAYMARVNRAVFSPFTQRLIRAATGLVLRKPIALSGDPYWTEMFKMDVDGCKSDLDEYARRVLMCSLTYGQSHILVDYPAPSGALSLAEERQQNRRPYWIEVDPNNLFGYRLDRESNYGNLVQVRIGEKAVLPDGDFGEKVYDQVRVIEPGRYRVFRKKDQVDAMYDVDDNSYTGEFETGTTGEEFKLAESGSFSLGEIPLVTVYSGKTDNLTSKPPLLDIAYLNLAHFQRQADLIHSLHVASQPMLVMEGYDDQTKDLAISVNYAMATQPGNKVYYVEPASSAFEAQSAEIRELQMQMATLGISTLSQQKFVAESADARRLDRVDTNSMLAMVSMELEQKLQKAFNLSAEYVGIEPPEVKISRDFDIERLIGQDITALTSLFDQQVIDREEFRDILVQGEVLPSANETESS
ncbi:portal protein [uncultured Mediterranean phage uvMED]|nr:portal protein [uncultured Mediterranean phage uvMED]